MRNLYGHHFQLKPGTRVYVPTDHGKARGSEIKRDVEKRWAAPKNFFHLRDGGHVAAVRLHHGAPWVASLDLLRFFDQISRGKIFRSLKRLGFVQADAWEMACDSTVDKAPPTRVFSVPFGFVQSPLIASLVLANSALGRRIERLRRAGVTVTVYMDDITVSGDSEQAVSAAIAQLIEAANLAGFVFNPEKSQPASAVVTGFNIEFGSGAMTITPERMNEFEEAFQEGNEYQQEGIYGYVASVNQGQLARLIP